MVHDLKIAECYRGFVNTWECDENAHLNVQGYAQRFELAARHAFAAAGGRFDATALKVRHIRYHKECGAGDLVLIRTHGVPDAANLIAHAMHDAETGDLLATAVDALADGAALPPAMPQAPVMDAAKPRSLSPEPDFEVRADAALRKAGYALGYAGIVSPHHCGPEGGMDDQFFIARVTDSVAHAWSRAGFTKAWLNANHCGRVAVEVKLSIGARPATGTLLHILTGLVAVNRSTLQFRHVFLDSETGQPFATTNVTGLVMDHTTRKAVRFSDAMRAEAEKVLVSEA